MSKLETISSTLEKIRKLVPVVRPGDMVVQGSLHWDRLNNHILPVLREAEKQITKASPPGTKSAKSGKIEVVSSINLASSVVDAMESGDIDVGEVKEAMAKLTDYLSAGVKKIDNMVATASVKPQSEEELLAAHDGEGEAKLFAKMARYADDLPTQGVKEKDTFTIKRLPVVPVFKTPVAAETLHKIGFKVVTNEGFYSVLGDQLCLGINVAKDKPKDINKRAQEIAQVFSHKMDMQYSVMGLDLRIGAGRKIEKTKGYVWFWLVPHALLTRMDRFGGAALQDWGFAFK